MNLTIDPQILVSENTLFGVIRAWNTQPLILMMTLALVLIPVILFLLFGAKKISASKRLWNQKNYWYLFIPYIIGIILLIFHIFPIWLIIFK